MQNFSQKSPSHEILLFFASQTEASCELHAQQQVCGCAIINMPYFIRGRNENIVRMEREGGSGQVLQPLQQCPNIKQENKHLDSCRTVYAQCYLLKADRSFEAVWIGNWKQGQNEKWLIPLLFSKWENLCLSGCTMLHQNPSTQWLFVTQTLCVWAWQEGWLVSIWRERKGENIIGWNWTQEYHITLKKHGDGMEKRENECRCDSLALMLDELDESVMEKRKDVVSFHF